MSTLCVSVDVVLRNPLKVGCKGQTSEQAVDYTWKPKACQACRTFYRSNGNCPRQQGQLLETTRKAWVKKTVNPAAASTGNSNVTAELGKEMEK